MAKGSRGVNKAGRSEGVSPFLQFPWWVIETPAFHSLSSDGRTALFYMAKRFYGRNNGKIGFGVRSGGFVRNPGSTEVRDVPVMSQTKMQAALREVDALMLARVTTPSSFGQKKRTRDWELTWLPCAGKLPTKEFMALSMADCQRIKVGLKTKPRSAGRTINRLTGPPAEQQTTPKTPNRSLQVRPQTYSESSQVRRQTPSSNHPMRVIEGGAKTA